MAVRVFKSPTTKKRKKHYHVSSLVSLLMPFILGALFLDVAHCRVLRYSSNNGVLKNHDQENQAAASLVGNMDATTATLTPVSPDINSTAGAGDGGSNTSIGDLLGSLIASFASGPSKRGPGH